MSCCNSIVAIHRVFVVFLKLGIKGHFPLVWLEFALMHGLPVNETHKLTSCYPIICRNGVNPKAATSPNPNDFAVLAIKPDTAPSSVMNCLRCFARELAPLLN
jgi:hypothetical protein